SCEVVPPLDDAMQTTAATDIAVSMAGTSRRSIRTNTRQVSSSVAMVMPEMGLEDDPTSPVSRDDTVTNRKPNSRIITATRMPCTLSPWTSRMGTNGRMVAIPPGYRGVANNKGGIDVVKE